MNDNSYCGPERRNIQCPVDGCTKPEDAANGAVKKVFNILGVNVDDPKQVEDFRKGLRVGEEFVILARRGKIASVTAFVGLAAAAIWTALTR